MYAQVWDTYAWCGEWAEIDDWYPDPELKIRCVQNRLTQDKPASLSS